MDVAIQILGTAFSNLAKAASITFTAFKSGSSIVSALSDGFSALSGTMLPIIAIATAVGIAINEISKKYTSVAKANEQMRESYNSYQEAQTNLDNINSELKTTDTRINELLAKDNLTFVEQSELDKLKETNEQLQIQADLAKRAVNKEARQAAEDVIKAYKKNFKENIDAESTNKKQEYANATGNNLNLVSDEKDLSAQIAAIRQFTKLRNDAQAEYNKAKSIGDEDNMEWWGKEVQRYNEGNQEIKDSIFEQVKLLQEYRDILGTLPEEELAKVNGASDLLKQIDDQIAYVYSELDPAAWFKIKFGEIFQDAGFAKAKDELVSLAEASNGIGITIDDVKKKYPELASAIESAGLSISDFVSDINSGIECTDKVARTVEEKITAIKDIFNNSVSGQSNVDSQINSFDKWLSSLDERNLDLVYQISLDTEAAQYNLNEWQAALDNAQFHFEDLMAEEDTNSVDSFSTQVTNYVKKIKVLQQALKDFKNGDFKNEDLVELITEFPELAGRSDDLGAAIRETLINSTFLL